MNGKSGEEFIEQFQRALEERARRNKKEGKKVEPVGPCLSGEDLGFMVEYEIGSNGKDRWELCSSHIRTCRECSSLFLVIARANPQAQKELLVMVRSPEIRKKLLEKINEEQSQD